MIVYNANKAQFVHEVRMNVIASKILDLIKQRGLNAGQDREFAAWQNSMRLTSASCTSAGTRRR